MELVPLDEVAPEYPMIMFLVVQGRKFRQAPGPLSVGKFLGLSQAGDSASSLSSLLMRRVLETAPTAPIGISLSVVDP